MERLEAKVINKNTYYYYSKWGWKNGKCRRLWQKYLGTLPRIVQAVDGGPSPAYAEVFQWGLPVAIWKECERSQVINFVDKLCPKRNQGLTVGQYIAIAALNRAMFACSKRSIWEWFSGTALIRQFEGVSAKSLTSQRFWDHMERISKNQCKEIWRCLLKAVLEREEVDASSISYDGTNFYTFIDSFNTRCEIAKRGKNKQGRNNLRQVSYALFCCSDGRLPLYYDVYEGNRNDARQFGEIITHFQEFYHDVAKAKIHNGAITLIFDKGNNSATNFKLLDELELNFVGSVKLGEFKKLAETPNSSDRFQKIVDERLREVKAFRTVREIAGKERVLVVTFNQNLFHAQWLTLQRDIEKALNELAVLQQRLIDRVNGTVKGGRAPTREFTERSCKSILRRQHLRSVIHYEIKEIGQGFLELSFALDQDALHEVANTHLGKTILVTSRTHWDDARIIRAYRSQYQVEDLFKEAKDRETGSWWPMQHWTDSKIQVHGLYCTIALLWRALMIRRIQKAGLNLSLKRVFKELGKIRQVINIFPKKRQQKKAKQQVVFTEILDTQQKILDVLDIKLEQTQV